MIVEIGHGFARPGRVTNLVRSSHERWADREQLSRIRRNPFNNETSRTKLGIQKFRLILKYNLHDAVHKANSCISRPRTRNLRLFVANLPGMRLRKGNFTHSRAFKCLPNVFLWEQESNNGTITFVHSRWKREKEIRALNYCSINVYKYCAIK